MPPISDSSPRTSLVNLGTVIGLVIGLGIGVAGTYFWFSPKEAKNTNTTTQAPTVSDADAVAFDRLRVSVVTETGYAADVIRALGSGQDFRAANDALSRQQAVSKTVLQSIYGNAFAEKLSREISGINNQVIEYVTHRKTGTGDPAAALAEIDTHITAIIPMVKEVDADVSASNIINLLRRNRDGLRGVADLSLDGKANETYARQQLATEAMANFVDSLER